MTTRDEHIAWCKQRAMEYVERDDLPQAIASMYSDLSKHPETERHDAIILGIRLERSGMLSKKHEVIDFIEGIN